MNKRVDKARDIINRQMGFKKSVMKSNMEEVERLAIRMNKSWEEGNFLSATSDADSIKRRSDDIAELDKEIRELEKQLSILEFIEREENE